jgi:hypothetical protein
VQAHRMRCVPVRPGRNLRCWTSSSMRMWPLRPSASMIRCPVSVVPRSPLSSAAAMIAGARSTRSYRPRGCSPRLAKRISRISATAPGSSGAVSPAPRQACPSDRSHLRSTLDAGAATTKSRRTCQREPTNKIGQFVHSRFAMGYCGSPDLPELGSSVEGDRRNVLGLH